MIPITYPINDCYVCLQGEGTQTGVAMILLRLHGCAVGCPWCDTKHTWVMDANAERDTLEAALGENPQYAYATAEQIVNFIRAQRQGPRWVLVTGGEPAQYALEPLVHTLQNSGYRVALETSGTETGHLGAGFDWVCVSPKIDMPGGKVIQLAALREAHEIKHVIGTSRDIDHLDRLLADAQAEGYLRPDVQICLQPVSMSQKATALCIDVVQQRGWRLSVQLHKYLNQP